VPQRYTKGMSDSNSEAAAVLRAHAQTIDDLHAKLAAIPGCDTERLAVAVQTYKNAHQDFEDDALECVIH
jgi:hypothetical protein